MNATAPAPARSVRTPATTAFTVDLVDGNGLDVAGEPVTARFRHRDGSEAVIRRTTDPGGRARFVDTGESMPTNVVVTAGREALGPLRPAPGAHLVIEM